MKNLVGFWSGVVLIGLGISLIFLALLNIGEYVGSLISGFYGLICLTVGIYMLLNLDKEDKIEEIKKNKKVKN